MLEYYKHLPQPLQNAFSGNVKLRGLFVAQLQMKETMETFAN
jgi:hypothetical protein